jgi:hypothetical protein
MAGDGAPMNAMWKMQRMSLAIHRKDQTNSSQLSAEEVTSQLNTPEHEEPQLRPLLEHQIIDVDGEDDSGGSSSER